MNHSIAAPFDGQFIVPDEPLQVPVGQALRVHVELVEAAPRFAELEAIRKVPVAARFQRAECPKSPKNGTLETCRHTFQDSLLLRFASDLPDAPQDLSGQHDHA